MVENKINKLHERYKKKLEIKFNNQISIYNKSLYKSPKDKIKIICNKCNSKETNRAGIILSRLPKDVCLHCKYERDLSKNKSILKFIKFLAKKTNLTNDQIINITNIGFAVILNSFMMYLTKSMNKQGR